MRMIFAAAALAACAAGAGERRPVYVNYDDTHFACSRVKAGVDVDEAEVRRMVRPYKGTDVSDLVFCVGGRIADVPNGAKDSWCDKYHQMRENGRDVCYTNHYTRLYRELWEVKKIDIYALWLDEARKVGIRPWLSFRMNDCHDNWAETSILHPNFFHEHPECRRVRHRAALDYYDNCFDYSLAAVRERELKYISEMLDRYGPDGIEIDWMREAFCFPPGREDAQALGGFMREVRRLADRAAARWGHAVRVAARVPAGPETALRMGFDIATWAAEKSVDVVVPAPRWRETDNEIPVDLWKRLVRGSGVAVVPGVELRHWTAKRHLLVTTEQLVGAAAAFYSQGADGFYLYNYFDDPCWRNAEKSYWKNGDAESAVLWQNQLRWLSCIGSPEKVLAAPRDHMVTYRDIVPLREETARPWPVVAKARRVTFFRLTTGTVPSGRTVTVRIGVAGKERPKVYVNSRACRYLRDEACVPAATDNPLAVYEVPGYAETAAVVEVVPDDDVMIDFLDVRIR